MEKKLHAAILAVMNEVQYIKNDKTVGSGYSSYKSISDEKVRETLRKFLIKHNLIVLQNDVQTDIQIDRWEAGGKIKQQVLMKATVSYKIIHTETGEWEIMQSVGVGVDPQDKSAGKALTYALKYALLNLFLIPTGEDNDKIHSDDIEAPQTVTKPELLPGTDNWKKAIDNVKSGKVTLEKIFALRELTEENKAKLTEECRN